MRVEFPIMIEYFVIQFRGVSICFNIFEVGRDGGTSNKLYRRTFAAEIVNTWVRLQMMPMSFVMEIL